MADKYKANLRIEDVNFKMRSLTGLEVFMDVDLTKPNYRLVIDTPTGGEVTFNRYATAEHVMNYVISEGWDVGDQLD
jgi:hypothetical protein